MIETYKMTRNWYIGLHTYTVVYKNATFLSASRFLSNYFDILFHLNAVSTNVDQSL